MVINDTVMGGKSNSQITSDHNGHIFHTGNINTQGGGFATFRSGDISNLLSQNIVGLKITYRGNTSNNVKASVSLTAPG